MSQPRNHVRTHITTHSWQLTVYFVCFSLAAGALKVPSGVFLYNNSYFWHLPKCIVYSLGHMHFFLIKHKPFLKIFWNLHGLYPYPHLYQHSVFFFPAFCRALLCFTLLFLYHHWKLIGMCVTSPSCPYTRVLLCMLVEQEIKKKKWVTHQNRAPWCH